MPFASLQDMREIRTMNPSQMALRLPYLRRSVRPGYTLKRIYRSVSPPSLSATLALASSCSTCREQNSRRAEEHKYVPYNGSQVLARGAMRTKSLCHVCGSWHGALHRDCPDKTSQSQRYGCARFCCCNPKISASSATTAGESSETDSAGIAGMTSFNIPATPTPSRSRVAEDSASSNSWSGESGCQVLMKYTALSNCVR